jgi:serine protease
LPTTDPATVGKRRFSVLLAAILAQFLPLAGFCTAQTDDYIIVYKTHQKKQAMADRHLFPISHNYHLLPALAAKLDPNQLKQFRAHPDIAYIEPDYKIYALSTSSDPAISALSSQTTPWGVSMVNAPAVWPKTKGAGVRVAVLDTGIDMFHPDRGNVVDTNCFVSGETVQDFNPYGHGTHTSGTIAAADNGIGVVGVAPEVDLLICKVLDDTGQGATSTLIAGIEWAVDENAKVISMSLGDTTYSSSLDTTCTNAYNAGVLLVAAAGNDGANVIEYPAGLSSVISVAAIDSTKTVASFSTYNSDVELAAPGVDVESTVPLAYDGTSSAEWNSLVYSSEYFLGTSVGTVTGRICDCGIGDDSSPANTCPDSVAGNIALIERGTATFQQKVENAKAKGAAGVIIYNNTSGTISGTLNELSPLVVVGILQSDGQNLQALTSSGITGTISVNASLYAILSGTSMATPHVAGVAALMFAASGINTTPAEIRTILDNSAQDLGAAGRDVYYGYGLVNASAALNLVTPHNCSSEWIMGHGLAGDINQDCAVNFKDLLILAENWLASCTSSNNWCAGADVNTSGTVNLSDFSKIASQWLSCYDPQHISCP